MIENGIRVNDYEQLLRLSESLHKSRLFKTGSVEQALTVILMGRELGIGPTTALSNIVIAAGKPTLGASLVGALIQKSGKYAYQVTEMTDQKVSVEFFEQRGATTASRWPLGVSEFTMLDAQRARLAGSQTWQQYPRNLLLARALTNGARWYCPEVFGGAIYDPEELGVSGILAPPEGAERVPDATRSVPVSTPSEGAAVDAEFVPDGGEGLTIEGLLETWSAEEILEANGGDLPQTDADLERVRARLSGEEVAPAEAAG